MTFGELIREKRVAADKSLRGVAKEVGVSHVLLGEVERGVRATLAGSHWHKLVAAVPGLTVAELKRAAEAMHPIELCVAGTSQETRRMSQLLARKIETGKLSGETAQRIYEMLLKDD